jgi:hypothetical protein
MRAPEVEGDASARHTSALFLFPFARFAITLARVFVQFRSVLVFGATVTFLSEHCTDLAPLMGRVVIAGPSPLSAARRNALPF